MSTAAGNLDTTWTIGSRHSGISRQHLSRDVGEDDQERYPGHPHHAGVRDVTLPYEALNLTLSDLGIETIEIPTIGVA